MRDVTANDQAPNRPAKSGLFSVEDTYWGYVVQSKRRAPTGVLFAQAASFFLAAGFVIATAGMLVAPIITGGATMGAMRLGVAVLFLGIAAYLFWFASRGARSDLHVDTSVGEIREVIKNRFGRSTTVGCYGFDAIGGVAIENQGNGRSPSLVLQYGKSGQSVVVAEGAEAQLIPLRDRLARDLIV